MLAKGVKAENVAELGHEGAHSGHLVAPNVAAPHHQHFFNVRLDFDVDGVSNSAMEMETSPLAGAANPYGNAFTMRETLLPTEKAARRDLDLATQRKWKIVSSSRSALGYPTGYVLVPGDNSVPYALPGSLVRVRAPFVDHHFWVTRMKESEMHAGGDYPTLARGESGLARWSDDDESIRDADIVAWYTMGVTHVPRPEEWPVMPVARIGFKLLPAGFFDRNPALDLPSGR
jgi:primary-amine oxidase